MASVKGYFQACTPEIIHASPRLPPPTPLALAFTQPLQGSDMPSVPELRSNTRSLMCMYDDTST